MRYGSLKQKKLFWRGCSSIGLYLGCLSKFPMLFIFLPIIGLQNNWILPRNFNVLSTFDSNEGDISALPSCGNENAIWKWVEIDVNSADRKCNCGNECLNNLRAFLENKFLWLLSSVDALCSGKICKNISRKVEAHPVLSLQKSFISVF